MFKTQDIQGPSNRFGLRNRNEITAPKKFTPSKEEGGNENAGVQSPSIREGEERIPLSPIKPGTEARVRKNLKRDLIAAFGSTPETQGSGPIRAPKKPLAASAPVPAETFDEQTIKNRLEIARMVTLILENPDMGGTEKKPLIPSLEPVIEDPYIAGLVRNSFLGQAAEQADHAALRDL